MKKDVFLMASDAAKILGRSAETVRYYERAGRLVAAIRTQDGTRIFKKADVEALASKLNGVTPETKPAA